MSQPHRELIPDHNPLAYFITFRTHGTWLHGDSRGSVDRFRNRYGTPLIPPERRWQRYNKRTMRLPPVKLDAQQRVAIEEAILETCKIRSWTLWARNVRTNHIHVVVSTSCDSEMALRALKANATRNMREAGCWRSKQTPWARRGSKRWLWTHEQLISAIEYVEYEQGEPLP